MKKIPTLAVFPFLLLLCSSSLFAEDYFFLLNRFSYMQVDTAKKAVKIWEEDKSGEEKVHFTSKLKSTGKNAFVTSSGTVFTLIRLGKEVVNDGNRGINSGEWKLTISGKGEEHQKVLKQVQAMVAFGKKGTVSTAPMGEWTGMATL